ncbi:MAG: sigma-54-dependent Fis family transcriptional regulator [Planctomycetes bacterium]|nr:sigma-54-dependent Fis family transcriptional regulator [Planctomycetota bacterium]
MNTNGIRILVVDDEPNVRAGLAKGLRGDETSVETAKDGTEALQKFENAGHQIVITDVRLPGKLDGLHLLKMFRDRRPETLVIVITAYDTIDMAVEAMRLGAYDFVTKPVDLNLIRLQVRKAAEHRRLVLENRQLRDRLAGTGEDLEIIGNCAATRELLRQIRQVAETDATVLIHGESGTGKELTARAIHRFSPRQQRPFVTVHLGALPETLLESELFGHEKGAFTDARSRKIGHFEAANGGTLFLDEITETSAKSQVDLLRVIEHQEFRRLGGNELISCDVRIVAATNSDIRDLVHAGKFREDLYYRLDVIPLQIPSLRERREDIPLLVEHFARHLCQRHQRHIKRFANEAMQVLASHSWPGNIRQIRNLVERLVVTVDGDVIHAEDLPNEMRTHPRQIEKTLEAAVEATERQVIVAALAECDNHRERTAKRLDISVRTLHYKMRRYGLH